MKTRRSFLKSIAAAAAAVAGVGIAAIHKATTSPIPITPIEQANEPTFDAIKYKGEFKWINVHHHLPHKQFRRIIKRAKHR